MRIGRIGLVTAVVILVLLAIPAESAMTLYGDWIVYWTEDRLYLGVRPERRGQ